MAQLAASEERLRLARDMHDLTGQSLSMITLKSELAARLLGRLPASADRDRVRDEIEQVAAVSRQTLRDIREAISGYRRPTLAVEVITARAALASAGIAARDDADLTLLSGTFDPDAEAALAWCLREAVTNVVRHSGARNCYISLTRRAGAMSLTVRDDGKGHSPSDGCGTQPLPAGTGPHSSGLHGMSERLSAVGGTLELRPDLHPGFRLIATVPAARPSPPRPSRPGGDIIEGMIRVLLAEDQVMIREALAALLSFEDDIEVVAQVGRGDEVTSAAKDTKPDVALLDIEMPGADGLTAAAALRRACPDIKIIILTTFGRPGYLRRAMESGASGFIVKDSPADKLVRTIRDVLAGQRVIDPDLAAAALAEGASPLTPREKDVLAAAAREEGATLAQIAAALYLSEGTVRNYLSSCIQKTGARNRAEAIRIAQARGWL